MTTHVWGWIKGSEAPVRVKCDKCGREERLDRVLQVIGCKGCPGNAIQGKLPIYKEES